MLTIYKSEFHFSNYNFMTLLVVQAVPMARKAENLYIEKIWRGEFPRTLIIFFYMKTP